MEAGSFTGVVLKAHQELALSRLRNGSILCGNTGSGKSFTAAAYYVANESPRDVFVITTAKKRDDLDWQRDFAAYGVGTGRGATVAGVLTIDSWNNISKYEDVVDAFFIFDEQRVVGSGQWSKSFVKIAKRNRWILLSATPGDTWMDYVPVFLAHGFFKNRTEFKREHVVYNTFTKFPKVDRYVGVGTLVRLRNSILVDMPYESHTIRHRRWIQTDYNKEIYKRVWEDRWNVYLNRPVRQVAELFATTRRVVNADPSRLRRVQEAMAKHPKLIVFYSFDYELEILRTLVSSSPTTRTTEKDESNSWRAESTSGSMDDGGPSPSSSTTSASSTTESGTRQPTKSERTSSSDSPLVVAEWNGHKHQPVPTGDHWVYLVQYSAGSEGWNCIETDAMLFYSLTYSYKHWHQAHGRIDRMNTPFIHLYYDVLWSKSWIDGAIRKNLSEKRNFNEASTGIKI